MRAVHSIVSAIVSNTRQAPRDDDRIVDRTTDSAFHHFRKRRDSARVPKLSSLAPGALPVPFAASYTSDHYGRWLLRVFNPASLALALYALQGSRRALARPFRAITSAFRGAHTRQRRPSSVQSRFAGQLQFTGRSMKATILSVARENPRSALLPRNVHHASGSHTRLSGRQLGPAAARSVAAIFLDNRHAVIAIRDSSSRTLDALPSITRSHQRALHHNAAA